MTDAKPMTAEVWAKRIMAYATNKASKDFDRIRLISRAIQQACDEARVESNEELKTHFKHWTDIAHAQGFADAKEKAAKICLENCQKLDCCPYGCDGSYHLDPTA